ncbi:MAG: hypothetical protein N6V49_10755, partial [Serratia symbiotica]|nr:hypothetical protein [Serratia symbiotica]
GPSGANSSTCSDLFNKAAFNQFSRKEFEFLFVHNLPVSAVGVNISKIGNYTISFTVSSLGANAQAT